MYDELCEVFGRVGRFYCIAFDIFYSVLLSVLLLLGLRGAFESVVFVVLSILAIVRA